MRLFLSSFRFGDRLDLFQEIVKPGATIGIIANALDAVPAAARADYARNIYDPAAELRNRGYETRQLDLRTFFGNTDGLEAALEPLDMVWSTGGNVFLLRRAMRQSGFDKVALPMIGSGKLAYGGESAGAGVASPGLQGMQLMDDPGALTDGYDPGVVWEGLNLIPFHLVPHYDCDSPDAPKAEAVTMYLLDQALPYRTMRDGDVLVRNAAGLRAYETQTP